MNGCAKVSRFGLSPETLAHLTGVFERFPEVTRVLVYGSRARGTALAASDIDVAVDAPTITRLRQAQCAALIEELPLIFSIDVVWLHELEDALALKQNIARDGVPIYPI